MAFFLNIDFESHVPLVAQIDENGRAAIAGGGRYIVVRPGTAEVACTVVDAYQGLGIGTILMRHLANLACDACLKELTALVLPENTAILKLLREFGFRIAAGGTKGRPVIGRAKFNVFVVRAEELIEGCPELKPRSDRCSKSQCRRAAGQ